MWVAYVEGYLGGNPAHAGDASRVLLVRQEDLLRRPDLVVDELARFGLPRNTMVFAPLEKLATGYGNEPRQETVRAIQISVASLSMSRVRSSTVSLLAVANDTCWPWATPRLGSTT